MGEDNSQKIYKRFMYDDDGSVENVQAMVEKDDEGDLRIRLDLFGSVRGTGGSSGFMGMGGGGKKEYAEVAMIANYIKADGSRDDLLEPLDRLQGALDFIRAAVAEYKAESTSKGDE